MHCKITYISSTVKGERGPDSIHLVGRHRYPFTFTLPQNIPSSFEGLHGKVRYYLQAVIDKPWKMDDICTKAVTVLDIVDLNNNPKAKVSLVVRYNKYSDNYEVCKSNSRRFKLAMLLINLTKREADVREIGTDKIHVSCDILLIVLTT